MTPSPNELMAAIVTEIREASGGHPVAVAFSGGLDSTTVAALAKEALGAPNVLLVTVNMGAYAYRRGNEIVLEMAEQLGLRQRCLLGQFAQHRVQRSGPACNRCTREIKLGMVKKVAPLRLIAKAGPGVMHDPHARYWLQHGRMQPDFAFPIEVQWEPARNNRLHTFQVVGFSPMEGQSASAEE